MLHLRRGNQAILRLAQMRLQRLMALKHIGHELSRLRKQLRRHLRLAQILGQMLIEAVQRVVREVAHLKRPEPLVQVIQAQTPLSEPLVRALQIAFDLRRRKARLIEHLPALQHARKHHKRTRLRRHRARERRLDTRCHRRRRIGQRIVGAQGIFAAQQHPVLQMLGKRIRVVDVLGGRRVVPIAVDELLQHHARIRGVGGRVVEAALENQLVGCTVLQREERATHAGKRRIGALHAKMLEQHPGGVLGIGRRIGGACQIGRHEHLARAASQRRRRVLAGHQHIGHTKAGALATAGRHDARHADFQTLHLVEHRISAQPRQLGGVGGAPQSAQRGKLFGTPRFRAVRHAPHGRLKLVGGLGIQAQGKSLHRRKQRVVAAQAGAQVGPLRRAIGAHIGVKFERRLFRHPGERRQRPIG